LPESGVTEILFENCFGGYHDREKFPTIFNVAQECKQGVEIAFSNRTQGYVLTAYHAILLIVAAEGATFGAKYIPRLSSSVLL